MRLAIALPAFVGVICFSVSAGADGIFKWTDAQGRVHFGDRPPSSGRAETLEDPGEAQPDGAPSFRTNACQDFQFTPEFKRWPHKKQLAYQSGCKKAFDERWMKPVERAVDAQERRAKQQQIHDWANRYSAEQAKQRRRSPRVNEVNDDWHSLEGRESQSDPRPQRWDDEGYCQQKYGRSCGDLANWKRNAVSRCEQNHLSRDCRDPSYVDSQKPLTIQQLRQKDREKDELYRQKLKKLQEQESRR